MTKITKDNSEKAIIVNDIVKTFRLPHENHSGFKQMLINMINKNRKKGYETQQVLKGVSFEVNKGDFFGIVGRNGSGKSTLLKLLSGIYNPDSGTIQTNGSVVPFIELGVGFNPELTGRENVFLNGALLGFSRSEMEVMYSDIVSFAELERFMDQKLKNYSSGMQVRLAFSIAIKAEGSILILDEVLAVGDEAFQRKCFNYFAQLKKEKKTVILVTHSMDSVQQFCNKALMIEKGEIVAQGNPAKVAQKYRELFMPESLGEDTAQSSKNNNEESKAKKLSQPVRITATALKSDSTIKMQINLMPKENISDSILSVFIDRDTGEQVYRFSTDERLGQSFNLEKNKVVKLNLEIQNIFPNGIFTIRASVKSKDRTKEYVTFGDIASFNIDRRLDTGSEWDIHWQPNEIFSAELGK